ncbi:MAG: DEAD/DEAH box helicase [Microbacterium pygmaeum]
MVTPHVNVDAIRRAADGGGFERGLAYFRRGAVQAVRWEPERSEILSRVSGSDAHSYTCSIRLDLARTAQPILLTTCSCPLRTGCKHVVASLLACNAVAESETRSRSALTAGDAAARSHSPARPTAPAWRSLVEPQLSREHSSGALALGFELRQRQSAAAVRWETRRTFAVTPQSLNGTQDDLSVGMRPLMRSPQTGKWIKGHASWDAVRRSGEAFPPEQVRWFAEFHSIARDVFALGAFVDTGEWLTLDTVASGLLWPHLRAAGSVGIPLVPTQDFLSLRLAQHAAASVQIGRADEETDAGGLRVSAVVRVDAETVDAASVRPISRSGIYAFAIAGDRIDLTLAPLEVSAPVLALLAARGRIEVPAADAGEFLRTVASAIARQSEVTTTGGIEIPSAVPPVPVLCVEFRPGAGIEYIFRWDYAGAAWFEADDFADVPPERDLAAEAAEWTRIEAVWPRTGEAVPAQRGILRDVAAAEFSARVIPALQRHGVRLETVGTRPRYRELTGIPEITVSTVESTDPDWLDLGVLVTIDGRRIPFTPLFTALSRGRKKILLSDGAYFSLSHPALDRLRELVSEAAELTEWETGPRISRYQSALWSDFEDLADEALPAVTWRATAEGLRDVERIDPTPPPAGLRAELRPYQQSGFDWLAFLWRHRLGGILADDMGLGKTLQMLALIAHARDNGERRPFLVIAPTSVTGTWAEESARFVPGLRVAGIDATRAKRDASVADVAGTADLVVTSYALLRLAEREFADVAWAGLVLDEAQFVKNAQTKLHRAARAVRADATYAITGTPLENSLTDLWSLLSLTAPGLFASARRFREEYVGPIERGKVPENEEGGPFRAKRLERLRSRIRPLVLRRTKESVAADLPAKQEQLLHIELQPAHRALYDAVLQRERQKVLGLLDDLDRNRFIVFRSLTLLRMLSLSPALVDPDHADIASSKLDALVEHLREVAAEGHRALVFSHFTSFLSQVGARLEHEGLAHVLLDGSTRHRQRVIDGFRGGEAPVFLISLKAGGFGLTLTEADYVFLLDPWWNPAAEAQAVDRAHRIGQTRAVMVYRMIATGTIEEKVMALQQRKSRLFQAVLDDGGAFAGTLTAEDIRALLDG